MLTRSLLAAAERSLRLALDRDPLTSRRVAALAGKVILIQASDPAWQLWLEPGADGIQLTTDCAVEPDCTLNAPSSLLAQLLLSDQRKQLLQDPQIKLSGDSQVLISLQNTMADLRLDGEAELARWLGPVPARALAQMARSGRAWGSDARETLTRSLAEYLTEESGELVGTAEAQASADLLYQLRLDLDRLEARVQQLSSNDPETPEA